MLYEMSLDVAEQSFDEDYHEVNGAVAESYCSSQFTHPVCHDEIPPISYPDYLLETDADALGELIDYSHRNGLDLERRTWQAIGYHQHYGCYVFGLYASTLAFEQIQFDKKVFGAFSQVGPKQKPPVYSNGKYSIWKIQEYHNWFNLCGKALIEALRAARRDIAALGSRSS